MWLLVFVAVIGHLCLLRREESHSTTGSCEQVINKISSDNQSALSNVAKDTCLDSQTRFLLENRWNDFY